VIFFGNDQPPAVEVLPEPPVISPGESKDKIVPWRVVKIGESQWREDYVKMKR